MTNIFIANLDWEISSADLKATFSTFGEVHLAHVVFDPKTKKSKGFGYVEMPNAEEAIKAIMALNGFEVNGRKLDVKVASPKSNRPAPKEKPVKKPGFKPGGGGGYKSGGYNNGPKREFDPNRKRDFSGERPSYGDRSQSGDRPSYGDRPQSGDRPSYNRDHSSGDKSSFGSQSQEERPSSGERVLRPRRNRNI